MMLLGISLDTNLIMGIVAGLSSVMVTMGVLSNPDSVNKGYGDDILKCSREGVMEKHVMVAGKMVCQACGAVYQGDTK